MGRSTDVSDYKRVWESIGNKTHRVDKDERVEDVLENGDIVGRLPPRYAGLSIKR